ncbi:MAG TPA: fatty acid oxidation complex subunit alpha FadB [Pseudomonadales bacterium]
MVYQGKTISVSLDQHMIAHMVFDATGQSVNKFDQATLRELREAIATLAGTDKLRGMLIESRKPTFIVGADITEFSSLFDHDEADIAAAVVEFNGIFRALEDLPFPTVCLIDGVCVGGGFELALATDYRIVTTNARLGLPEVKLGINPGFGGTVRLPRLIGIDNAVEWIATGKEYRAEQALAVGAVDGVVEKQHLIEAGQRVISQANHNDLDFIARRQEKQQPVLLNDIERLMAFTTAKGLVAAEAGPHMPAPLTAVKSLEQSTALHADEAVKIEAKFFARLAKTDVAGNLVALFLNEQALSKRTGKLAEHAEPITHVSVIGAGIMGGGIAYQAAFKGKQVAMKDIARQGLEQGMAEASALLSKRVDRGRMSASAMAEVLTRITPTLHYAGCSDTDIAIEAVVENLKVKQSVLAELEQQLPETALIASNTSTLSISRMASGLKRPENFCGMHFFNPVHRMPLVEVIRGDKTSQSTINRVVKLARDMGKTPIVVNDCAGFYVNRVLFPYLAGFNLLIRDGADFQQVDKVMEAFGWPMGPAYLIDVVGIDTACHAAAVMADAFPERMGGDDKAAVNILHNYGRLGQKNGKGFYLYRKDKKGKPVKQADAEVYSLIKPAVHGQQSFDEQTIIERLMVPMCLEVVRCLNEQIVENPVDADMGLLMGIGFPLFRGGAVRYMESLGLDNFVRIADKYRDLGELYQAPASLIERAAQGRSYFASEESAS